jgi:SNF2 family DNA or RNA helicase
VASVVSVEQSPSEVRVRVPKGQRSFDTADEIYLCNILPGERAVDGKSVAFDARALGQSGIADLFDYLRTRGFELSLDSQAKGSLAQITSDKRELADAKTVGARLKKKPSVNGQVKGMRRTLKPFQSPAVGHMLGIAHAANFSVPGSGKTTIALAAFLELRQRKIVDCLVVIGPRSAFAPWEGELAACFGGAPTVTRISGSKLERKKAWRNGANAQLVLLNYHVAANDVRALTEYLQSRRCMLVLDESHHIKSIADSKWALAVRKAAPFATKRIILSGTPAPNSLVDLWSQFTFLYPSALALGTRDEFFSRIERSGANALREVRDAVSPLFWRIKKRELSLPKPTTTKIRVRLGEVQSAIYGALSARVLTDSQKAPKELARLQRWRRAKMIRLLQASSNPSLLTKYSDEFKLPPLTAAGLPVTELIEHYSDYEVPAKIAQAVSLLRKLLARGKKVVVWTSFVHNIVTLQKILADVSPLPLYGAIPASKAEDAELNRESIIDRFLHHPSAPVLIANPAACAESISLHSACHDAIYLDRTFNGAHFMQSKDRIHRVGLKPHDKINYFLLIAADTIDEVVDARLEQKQRRMLQLLETDFPTLNLDLPEDVVSEEGEEEVDFRETLKQIAKLRRT